MVSLGQVFHRVQGFFVFDAPHLSQDGEAMGVVQFGRRVISFRVAGRGQVRQRQRRVDAIDAEQLLPDLEGPLKLRRALRGRSA